MALKTIYDGPGTGCDGKPCRIVHQLNEVPPYTIFLSRGTADEKRIDERGREIPPNPERCEACGAMVSIGQSPFCPHDGRAKSASVPGEMRQ